MTKPVPCPNPACTAVFAPESLKGTTRLACPRCGTVFQFRAGPVEKVGGTKPPAAPPSPRPGSSGSAPKAPRSAPPASSRSLPASRGHTPAPPTRPAATAQAVVAAEVELVAPPVAAAPPPPSDDALAFTAEPGEEATIVRRRNRRRRGNGWQKLVTLLVVVAAAGGATWGILWLPNFIANEQSDAKLQLESNFHLPAPGRDWKKDQALQQKMQVGDTYRRMQPAATMAFLSHDYKTRLPSDGELMDEALGKLHLQFKRIDTELRSRNEARLGGQPALALDFDATDFDDVDVNGTVYLLGHRGYGYWLFLWAATAEKDAAAAELERIRGSFVLGNKREGWKEKPRETEALPVADVGIYFAFPKAIWESDDKSGYDPKAVRVLKGTFPADGTGRQRERYAGKIAVAQMLVLDRAADLKAAGNEARAYVLAAQADPERGNYPKTTLTTLKDKAGVDMDRDVEFGTLRGRLTKLQMTNTEDRERFVVLAAVNRPKGLLVVWCECDWSLRDYWEQEFSALLNSISPLKPGAGAKPAKGKDKEKPEEKMEDKGD